MSYCRFSSDDFRSDVYCYAHVYGGYCTHVAMCRIDFTNIELPPPETEPEAWAKRYMIVQDLLDGAPRVAIGLSRDGQTFMYASAEDARALLISLREEGYHVPQSALDRLAEEIQDENDES